MMPLLARHEALRFREARDGRADRGLGSGFGSSLQFLAWKWTRDVQERFKRGGLASRPHSRGVTRSSSPFVTEPGPQCDRFVMQRGNPFAWKRTVNESHDDSTPPSRS